MPIIGSRGAASAKGFGFTSSTGWKRIVLSTSVRTISGITAGGGNIVLLSNVSSTPYTTISSDNFTSSTQYSRTVTNINSKNCAYVGGQHLFTRQSSFGGVYECNTSTGAMAQVTPITGSFGQSSNVETDGSYYYVGANTDGSLGFQFWRIFRSGTAALNFNTSTQETLTPDFGSTQPGVSQIVKFGSDVYATPFQTNSGYSIYRRNGSTPWTSLTNFGSGTTFSWLAANSSIIIAVVNGNIYSSTGSSFTLRLASGSISRAFWGGNNWYAYNSTGSVFYSSSDGISWSTSSININAGDTLAQGAADGTNKCIPFTSSTEYGVYVKS